MSKKGNPLVYAIQHQPGAKSHPRLVLSELVGTYLESNQNTHDSGGGGYQLTGHGASVEARAHDPVFSTAYMRGAYQAAVREVGRAAFRANPKAAAERAAYLAERPKYDYYTTQGAGRVDAAFSTAVAEVKTVKHPKGQPPVVAAAPGYTAPGAAKRAADLLYAGGLRGHDLVLSLAYLWGKTGGQLAPSDVKSYVSEYNVSPSGVIHQIQSKPSTWSRYIGHSLIALKAAGHPTKWIATSQDIKGTGGPTKLQKLADDVPTPAVSALTDLDGFLKAVANPGGHLSGWFRFGLIAVGGIVLIIALAKLAGGNTLPPIGG